MQKYLVIYGAILGLLSVIVGAMADHALTLTVAQTDSLDTAIRYNMFYAMFIVVLSVIQSTWYKLLVPALIFSIGTTLFAGGIYLSMITGLSWLVYLTPVGGLTLMVGWLSIIVIGVLKGQRSQ